MEGIIVDFIEDLSREKEMSLNTRESYARDLKSFYKYLNEYGIDYKDVRRSNIITYIMYLKHSGKAPSSISRSISSIRAFYHMMIKKHVIENDPTLEIESPKVQKKIPDVLTIEEVDKLLSMPDVKTKKGARDSAMLELLYATGMKVSELILINIGDIDLKLGYIKCESFKKRVIPVGRKAVESVSNYIQNYREELLKDKNEQALFVNLHGQRITRQGFWKIIKYYTKLAGINKDITPHIIRSSFAVHMIENGADLKSVQEMLGHSDISTTEIYASMIKTRINDVYKKFHPRA